MTTMPEELDALDVKIRRLKQEYEQYFLRILKREPLIHKKEIEGLILRYTNMTINNTADQFKLNCLMSRFNSYRQYWVRTLRAIEDGVYVRRAESGPIASQVSSMDWGGISAPHRAGNDREGPEEAQHRSPEMESRAREDLTPLYNEYIEARKKNNINVKGLSKEKFLASVKNTRDRIARTYDVTETEVTVIEKDGQVKLVIKPAGVKAE